MIKLKVIAFYFLLSTSLFAGNLSTVTVYGKSTVKGRYVKAARETAEKNAIKNALFTVVSRNIGKARAKKAYGILDYLIYETSNEFIESFRVLKKNLVSKTYSVKLEVIVREDFLKEKLTKIGFFTKKKDKPKVFVIIGEKGEEESEFYYFWHRNIQYTKLEKKVLENLLKVTFRIVGRPKATADLKKHQEFDKEKATDLGKKVNADYIAICRVQYQKDVAEKNINLSMFIDIYSVDDERIVERLTINEKSRNKKNLESIAAKILSAKIIEPVLNDWQESSESGDKFLITIKDIRTPQVYKQLKTGLDKTKKLKGITIKSMQKNEMQFELISDLKVEKIAVLILKRKYDGFKLSLVNKAGSELEFRVR